MKQSSKGIWTNLPTENAVFQVGYPLFSNLTESRSPAFRATERWTRSTDKRSNEQRQNDFRKKITMSKQTPDNPQVIIFPPALYAGTLLAGLVIDFFFPIRLLPRWTTILSGAAAITIAVLIAISAISRMRRAKTAVNPALPTTAIVCGGIFGLSRNPIYVAFTLLSLGIALLFNALVLQLLLPPLLFVVQNGIIKREEIYLERKFGDEYLRYKVRVRRWL